jgi:hypothetical protein
MSGVLVAVTLLVKMILKRIARKPIPAADELFPRSGNVAVVTPLEEIEVSVDSKLEE